MTTLLRNTKKPVKHWFAPAIIGSVPMIIGIYIFITPLEIYGAFTPLIGISLLISGILGIIFSIENKSEIDGLTFYLTGGLFNTIIGIVILSKSEIIILMLPFIVGYTLLFQAIQGLSFAFVLKNYSHLRGNNLTITSILRILISTILICNPIFTRISLTIITALAFVLSGIGGVVLSVQIRKLKKMQVSK